MEDLINITRAVGMLCILVGVVWLVLSDDKHKNGASTGVWVDAWLFGGIFTFLSALVKGAASVIEDRSKPVFIPFVVLMSGVSLVVIPYLF